MKTNQLALLIVIGIISSGCSSDNATSSSTDGTTSSSSSSSSSTPSTASSSETSSTDTSSTDSGSSTSSVVYTTSDEIQAALEAQTMSSNSLAVGSYFKKMYPYQSKYRVLTATEISDTEVGYEREIYDYDSSFSFDSSGSFWNGNLSLSFGSAGWDLESSTSGLVTTQSEVINRIFSDYGTCTLIQSGEVTFMDSTYMAYQLYCTNGSSKMAYSTVIPDLPLWLNPVQQVVYTRSGYVWSASSSKSYYVFEYTP